MDYLQGLKDRHKLLKQEKEKLEFELSKVSEEYFAIDTLLRITDKDSKVENVESIYEDYPSTGKVSDKILFALKKLGKATSAEIEKFLKNIDANANTNSILLTISNMGVSGKIKVVEKRGRTNVYSLNI